VILSHATHLYLDLKHEPDPEESGLYWATREVPLKKVFSYRPDSVYDNMDVDLDGTPLDREKLCADFGCPELTTPNNVIGLTTLTRRVHSHNLWQNVWPLETFFYGESDICLKSKFENT